MYMEGAELVDGVIEATRQEVEKCDSLQGFHLSFSLGGSTGSSIGTLLVSKLKENYPDKMVSIFSVLPSPKVGSSIFLLL